MFIFFTLLFKIIPPKDIKISFTKKYKKSDILECGEHDKYELENFSSKPLAYLGNCQEVGSFFSITNSRFINCHISNNENECFFMKFRNSHGVIKRSIFDTCTYKDGLIGLFISEVDYLFRFYYNKINKCSHYNHETSIVYNSYYYNNDIQNNTITFDKNNNDWNRVFNIFYYGGCKFIGNSILNANSFQSSAINFEQKGQSKEKFVISDCIFDNCRGTYSATFILVDVTQNLKFKNLSFLNCQSFYIEPIDKFKGEPRGYFFRIDALNNGNDILHTKVDFIDCTFDSLVCNGQSGGGIGIMIRKKHYHDANKYSFALLFENTTFRHLRFEHYKYGGGAISFAHEVDENRFTQLTVKNCIFYNITSQNGGGGAIYYNAPSQQLIIEQSNFKDIGDKNIIGGCIYVKHQSDPMPINIKNCHFENTTSVQGGAIYIDWNPSSISLITITGCTFYKTAAVENGNAIVVDKTQSNEVTISDCTFNDCGSNKESFSIMIDAYILNFISNLITFSDSNQSCGCLELKQIQTHNIIGNVFKNVRCTNTSISAAINYVSIYEEYSLFINNNTFDNVGFYNQGRIIFFQAIKYDEITFCNNTIKNFVQGGILIKFVFQSDFDLFVIESCKFINNTFDNLTAQIWIDSSNQFSYELLYEKCLFENCSNSGKGGALYQNTSSIISIYECNFIGNDAKNNGGAVTLQKHQKCQIENCIFIRNRSENGSGAIQIETNFQNSIKNNINIIITKCIFDDNQGKFANGIYVTNSPNEQIFISNCTFNDCGKEGYIVSLQSNVDSIIIENCTFDFLKDLKSLKVIGIHSSTDCLSLRGNTFHNFQNAILHMICLLNQRNRFELIENNIISSSKNTLFYVENSLTMSPIIKGNRFENIRISDTFIVWKLDNDIKSIIFDNNTFNNFKTYSHFGGVGLDLNHRNKEISFYLQFNNCYFMNNKNSDHTDQGVISCDFNMNNGNIELSLFECYFENNYKNQLGSSIYANIQHDIQIHKCNFTKYDGGSHGTIYIIPDYGNVKTESSISIVECNFYKNQIHFFSSIYISSGSTKSINIQKCTFTEEDGGICISKYKNNINIEENHFLKTYDKAALKITCISENSELNVNKCIFESCNGTDIGCFIIQTITSNFKFENNIIKNNKGTGCQNYFGSIDCNNQTQYLEIKNNTFANNVCNSLYGGGIGLKIIGIQYLIFNQCNFNNNTAKQDKSMSRPHQGSNKPYYNGDGGCIQIGYICSFNNFYINFLNCIFKNNKAQRHGGAIAIQTIWDVNITKCIFESNVANYDTNVLLNYNKKQEGRGGAIYINPTQSYDEETSTYKKPINNATTILIEECQFRKNSGFDGYAFYIEGDDQIQNAFFEINENRFIDNYNENNYIGNNKNNIFGAVIATEIFNIYEKKLINDNNFRYTNKNIVVNELSYVDHNGKTPISKNVNNSNKKTIIIAVVVVVVVVIVNALTVFFIIKKCKSKSYYSLSESSHDTISESILKFDHDDINANTKIDKKGFNASSSINIDDQYGT